MSRIPSAQRIAEYLLLLFLAGAILWRGGKSVDATWMLGIVTLMIVLSGFWYAVLWRTRATTRSSSTQQMTVPFTLWGLLLFFLAWTVFSYLSSETRTYGLDEVIRDTACIVLFLWIVRRAGNQKLSMLLDGFPRIVVAAGAVAVLFGVAVYMFQPVNRFVGTFLDWRFHTDYWPNAWAQFVLLAWPLGALLIGRETDAFRRRSWMVAVGLLLGSLFLSYSRGAFIAFVGQCTCGLTLWAVLLLRDVRVGKAAKKHGRTMSIYGAGVLIVAVVLFGMANVARGMRYDVQSVGDKVTFRAAEGTSSIDERAAFFRHALILSTERPLLGYGPYSFRFAQPHLMTGVFETSDHPHNVFLKYAAERGWPAAIVFLVFLAYVIWLSTKQLFFDRKNDWSIAADMHTVALLVAVLGVIAHNLIDYNLQFVGIALPFWIALALLSTRLAEKRPVSRASFSQWRIARSLSRVEGVAIALLAIVVVWEGAFLVVSSFGRRAEADGATVAALDWYERSSLEWFSRDLLLARARLLEGQGLVDEADAVLAMSIDENLVDPRAWRMRAELALRRDEHDLAYQYAAHAYSLGKYTDMGILRVLIDAGLAAGQRDALGTRKLEFDALFGAYAEAIQRNTHYIALGGNVEELQAVAEQLATLFPTDAARYRDIAADAAEHAAAERALSAARPAGLLW